MATYYPWNNVSLAVFRVKCLQGMPFKNICRAIVCLIISSHWSCSCQTRVPVFTGPRCLTLETPRREIYHYVITSAGQYLVFRTWYTALKKCFSNLYQYHICICTLYFASTRVPAGITGRRLKQPIILAITRVSPKKVGKPSPRWPWVLGGVHLYYCCVSLCLFVRLLGTRYIVCVSAVTALTARPAHYQFKPTRDLQKRTCFF